jgi:uncharacterized membrane protein
MTGVPRHRLGYIDWMRGLACVLMFQTHCYDSWLSGAARKGAFYRWSQLGGTLPAPLFLFLAGVAFAFVTDRSRDKGKTPNEIAAATIRRGAEIYGAGLLFRVQEFLLGQPAAPWTDLLRMDILNTIGISMMLMGALCWAMRTRWRSLWGAIGAATATAMLTPPLWTTWRPRFLPWFLETYLNGVHIYNKPQAWLIPIFPWAGFGFAGLAVGFLLVVARIHEKQGLGVALLGLGGAGCFGLGLWLDALPFHLYASYDFWHSSPCFFLIRVGVLLMILPVSFLWCRYGPGKWGFSPMIQLGVTSLLVYWVHIEFVYGRFSILTKRAQDLAHASAGLATIFLAMVALSILRTRMKGHGGEILAWMKGWMPAQD